MKREAAPRRTRIESKHSNAGSFTPRLCLPALESTWERQRNQSWFCFCCPSLLCFLKNTSSTMRTELRFSRRWLRDTRKTKTFSLGGETEFKRIFFFWLSGGEERLSWSRGPMGCAWCFWFISYKSLLCCVRLSREYASRFMEEIPR